MDSQCIIAEFETTDKAQLGLEVLAKAGYGEQNVSFVSRNDDPQLGKIVKLEQDASNPVSTVSGAGIGGLLGGALAAPVAVSTLIGPIILIGPLVGVGLGAMIGSMVGGAKTPGLHDDEDWHYADSVREGAVLVIVTGEDSELNEAEASLRTAGPASLRRYRQPTEGNGAV
jgi:uncharacterized membrane protein